MNNFPSHEIKVQFAEETNDTDHHLDIQVQVIEQYIVNVHLGFLQLNHKYEIKFSFECLEPMENIFNLKNHSTEHVQIVELKILDNNKSTLENKMIVHNVTVHLFAYKDKFLKEKILLKNNDNSKALSFIFHAKVLTRDKGTPFLKNGIKSIGFHTDNEFGE